MFPMIALYVKLRYSMDLYGHANSPFIFIRAENIQMVSTLFTRRVWVYLYGCDYLEEPSLTYG